jgi:hypothetical protein
MREFNQHLDKASLDALNALLGSKIQSILSPDCDVDFGSAVITVSSISIPLGPERFFVLNNDWTDTPKEYIDYFFLSAHVATEPQGTFYNPKPGPGGFNYKPDHLSLHLGPSASVIRVDILSATQKGASESVSYDAGLLIERCDGRKIAIVRLQSITGYLQIAHTSQDIAQAIAGLAVRSSVAGPNSTVNPAL